MPVIQTFVLIFSEKLIELGFSNSKITTIINTQQAVSSCTGMAYIISGKTQFFFKLYHFSYKDY